MIIIYSGDNMPNPTKHNLSDVLDGGIFERFLDPILLQKFDKPFITGTGYSYSESVLQSLLARAGARKLIDRMTSVKWRTLTVPPGYRGYNDPVIAIENKVLAAAIGEFESIASDTSLPDTLAAFICPDSNVVMMNAVVCPDGLTREKEAALKRYTEAELIPDYALRSAIEEYHECIKKYQVIPQFEQMSINMSQTTNACTILALGAANVVIHSPDSTPKAILLFKLAEQFISDQEKYKMLLAMGTNAVGHGVSPEIAHQFFSNKLSIGDTVALNQLGDDSNTIAFIDELLDNLKTYLGDDLGIDEAMVMLNFSNQHLIDPLHDKAIALRRGDIDAFYDAIQRGDRSDLIRLCCNDPSHAEQRQNSSYQIANTQKEQLLELIRTMENDSARLLLTVSGHTISLTKKKSSQEQSVFFSFDSNKGKLVGPFRTENEVHSYLASNYTEGFRETTYFRKAETPNLTFFANPGPNYATVRLCDILGGFPLDVLSYVIENQSPPSIVTKLLPVVTRIHNDERLDSAVYEDLIDRLEPNEIRDLVDKLHAIMPAFENFYQVLRNKPHAEVANDLYIVAEGLLMDAKSDESEGVQICADICLSEPLSKEQCGSLFVLLQKNNCVEQTIQLLSSGSPSIRP